jgi:hypothetical protein
MDIMVVNPSLDLKGKLIRRNYGTEHGQQAPLLVPFFLSNKGYGIFLNSTFPNTFDFNSERYIPVSPSKVRDGWIISSSSVQVPRYHRSVHSTDGTAAAFAEVRIRSCAYLIKGMTIQVPIHRMNCGGNGRSPNTANSGFPARPYRE